MQLRPEDISIAVTVYRRLEYIDQAVASAVNQTVPVKVWVSDDGCQDVPRLQELLAKYGARVEYRRNPQTLGLFRNMNACIENCTTPWLSILHDDDQVSPDFVEKILAAALDVERCSLFCGSTIYMDTEGRPFHWSTPATAEPWRRLTLDEIAIKNWFPFPGQLMHAPTARAAGGFPEKSLYTGDWELWFRLAMVNGVVQLSARLGLHRTHLGADRGTTAAAKTGRRYACSGMQAKRNLARLRRSGMPAQFDRKTWVKACGPLYRDLLVYTWTMPAWLLTYNRRILLMTEPAGKVSRLLQVTSRIFGNFALRFAGLGRLIAIRLGVKMGPTF